MRSPVYLVAPPSQHTQLELACFSLPSSLLLCERGFPDVRHKALCIFQSCLFLLWSLSVAIKSICAVGPEQQWIWPHREVWPACCYAGTNTPTAVYKVLIYVNSFGFYYQSISCYQYISHVCICICKLWLQRIWCVHARRCLIVSNFPMWLCDVMWFPMWCEQ